jgi:hypothetical protein
MSFTPANVYVYASAQSGAMAGMGIPGFITDENPVDYAGIANMAGAFAQEFDTQWAAQNRPNPNIFDQSLIATACEEFWNGRSPSPAGVPFTVPGTYANECLAIIALIVAGNTFNTNNGTILPEPSNPSSNVQLIWYIDAANSQGTSSNSNNGLTPATALLSFQEAVNRLGTLELQYAIGVVFYFLSNDITELIVFNPIINNNGLVNFVANPTLLETNTISGLTAKSAAGPLTANLGTGQAQGLMVVNTSKSNSVAFIDSLSGSTSTITQPYLPSVTTVPPAAWWLGGASGNPAQVNNWANGDTVQLYQLTQVNIGRLAPTTVGVWEPTFDGLLMMVGNIWIPDLSTDSPAAQGFQCSTTVRLTQCRVDSFYEGLGDPNNGVFEQIFNCWMPGCGVFRNIGIIGGAINSKNAYLTMLHGCNVYGDIILHGNTFVGTGGNGVASGGNGFGVVCLAGTLNILGPAISSQVNYTGNNFYGTYTINVGELSQPGQLYFNGTAVSVFQGTPTLQMNGHTSAQGLNRSTGQFFFGISLTPTLLDTATPTGFGGIAFSNDLVSVYSKVQAL